MFVPWEVDFDKIKELTLDELLEAHKYWLGMVVAEAVADACSDEAAHSLTVVQNEVKLREEEISERKKTKLIRNFNAELRTLLQKYDAVIEFSCGDRSDIYGIYDGEIRIYTKKHLKKPAILLASSSSTWAFDYTDCNGETS